MQDDRLEEIAGRLAAATPGPWEHNGGTIDEEGGGRVARIYGWSGCHADWTEGNGEFIAHAPADIAWLLRVAMAARDLDCDHRGDCPRQFGEHKACDCGLDALRAALESR